MEIKFKILFKVIILLSFVCIFFSLSIYSCYADEPRAEILFLGEPTYMLTNEVIKDNIVGRSYQINVTLYNSGDLKSEELVVNLSDEEGYSLKVNEYVDIGETKIIPFNWSTLINRDQQVTIQFYPSNIDATWDQYNSGLTTITIQIDNNGDSSDNGIPGFELILIILAIGILAFLRKKKE